MIPAAWSTYTVTVDGPVAQVRFLVPARWETRIVPLTGSGFRPEDPAYRAVAVSTRLHVERRLAAAEKRDREHAR